MNDALMAAWFLRGLFAGMRCDRRGFMAKPGFATSQVPEAKALRTAELVTRCGVFSPMEIYEMQQIAEQLGFVPNRVKPAEVSPQEPRQE